MRYQEVEYSSYLYHLLQPRAHGIGVGLKMVHLSHESYVYVRVSQGMTKVESIDDNGELAYAEDSFFTEVENFDCYKLTAGVLTSVGKALNQKGREEQAESNNYGTDTLPGKAAAL